MVKLILEQTSVSTWAIMNYNRETPVEVASKVNIPSQYDAEQWARCYISSWPSWSITEVLSLKVKEEKRKAKEAEEKCPVIKKTREIIIPPRQPQFPLRRKEQPIMVALFSETTLVED